MRYAVTIEHMTIRCFIIIFLISVCLWCTGCQPAAIQPEDRIICPGKPTLEEAIEVLALQSRNTRSFLATAECTFHYQDESGKEKKQVVGPMAVRFIPPDRILFRGSRFGKEIGFGANENEFWLRIKPEWDSFWWGTRDQAAQCDELMLINPYNVIEALGIFEVTTDWQLSHEQGFDIFTLLNGKDTLVKRIYVNACDYLTERIEYYDKEGFLAASAVLSDYTTGADGIVIPSDIEIASYRYGIKEYLVAIELKHIRPFAPTDKQRFLLFKRPGRDGFEHLYRLGDDCEFIEEGNE